MRALPFVLAACASEADVPVDELGVRMIGLGRS